MKLFFALALVAIIAVALTGCITVRPSTPLNRERIAYAVDVGEVGVSLLLGWAEHRGHDVSTPREHAAATFTLIRSLVDANFKGTNKEELEAAIADLRQVSTAAVNLCLAVEVNPELITLAEQYAIRALDALEQVLQWLPEVK